MLNRKWVEWFITFELVFDAVLDIAWKISLVALSIHIIRLENLY